MKKTVLCFGYGSNMSSRRMLERAPSARLLGRARLVDYRLVFHKISKKDGSGKADVVPVVGEFVWGALYEVTEPEKKDLDKFEGLGKGYDEKEVTVELDGGETVAALIYFATNIDVSLKPYTWYVTHILKGAEEHKLPEDYLQKLRRVYATNDPDKGRESRELAVYN